MNRFGFFSAVLAALALALFLPASPAYRWTFRNYPGHVEAAQGLSYELDCPAGLQRILASGFQTFNTATGKYRVIACVDNFGKVTWQADSLAPGTSFTIPATLSGTIPPANLGTGTPGAGKYVDGGTGAWTVLPSSTADATFGWGMFGQTLGAAIPNCSSPSGSQSCVITVLPGAHTIVRLTYQLQVAPAGCTTSPVIGVRDLTSATTLASLTIANGMSVGFVDSGPLSVGTTAGHVLGVGQTTQSAGCTTNAVVFALTAVYQ